MEDDTTIYISTPVGSLVTRDSQEESRYLDIYVRLPANLQQLLMSRSTGSYLRGVTKDFQIPLDQAPKIAFTVLRVGVGEIDLPKLGSLLSSELKLPNDKAQSIAKEIEKELFTPVMMELNQWLEKQKKQKPTQQAKTAGASNVIDLKNQ